LTCMRLFAKMEPNMAKQSSLSYTYSSYYAGPARGCFALPETG